MSIKLVNFLDVPYDVQLEARNWRNQENVTRFFQIPHIDEQTHKNWLERLKDDNPKTIAFMIKCDEIYVGVAYFHSINYDEKIADWGMYISDKTLRGKGIGTETLTKCLEYAKKEINLQTVFLEVLENNTNAIKLYEKLGFKKTSQKDNVIRYKNKY